MRRGFSLLGSAVLDPHSQASGQFLKLLSGDTLCVKWLQEILKSGHCCSNKENPYF